MNENKNVTERLNELLTVYDFNKKTLSKYLELPVNHIECLAQGNMEFLSNEPSERFRLFNKILFLYASATEDKDLKLSAFLKVLISYHGLSQKTIAKMAGVETNSIGKFLSDPPKHVSEEEKYKIAVTVMALRFFLKDCETAETGM